MTWPPSKEFVLAFIAEHGCFCGGSGQFTDHNCGAEFLRACPHCGGSGKKRCECEEVSLTCPKI